MELFEHLDKISLVLVTLYIGYKEFLSGNSKLAKDTIDYSTKRIAQLQEENKIQIDLKHRAEDEKVAAEKTVAARDATIIEKDIQIKSLTDLLSYQNPDVLNLLKDIKDINRQMIDFMKIIYENLNRSNQVLDYQTQMLEKGEHRSKKIDKASISHEGEPMRVPTDLQTSKK